MTKQVKRLFNEFKPSNYQLDLIPDRETMTFNGIVKIDGQKTGRPSQRFTFHANGLKIIKATITKHDKSGDKTIPVKRLNIHKSLDEIRIHTNELVYPGRYSLRIDFDGQITRQMSGIYPCFFKHNGKNKTIIATQFESHHAREVFPCIDEPEAKATFDLSLTTPANESVLANTPIKKQLPADNGKLLETKFETTPIMSTYLLAFAYGELQRVTTKSKRGIEVSSWATVAQPKSHLNYANDEAVKLLDFYEDYFKVDFPLNKLDQVALPDFDSLAMENWGLITYREIGLLTDPINRSISGERLITMVIAHELSHQWFGNLVTMKWWDDLWLNESFASIMESLAPDYLHPDWQEWEDFTSSRIVAAANRDVYKDVQPVGVKVQQPDEILTLFDPSIVYAKGARILKMLFDYIGEEAFKTGLKAYFKAFAYKNAERGDLWQKLSESSGKDVGKIMTPWIEQSGTPELKIKAVGNQLELSQQRFLLDGEDKKATWPIPILADHKIQPDLMETTTTTVSYQAKPIFNPIGSGHYIIRYEDDNLVQNLQQQIINRDLTSAGRINSLNDMLLQTQKGELSLTSLLGIIQQSTTEDRDAVWSIFMRIIGSAQALTDDNKDNEQMLIKLKKSLSSSWFEYLGWDDKPKDEPNTKQLRTTILALTIAGEDKQAIKMALDKYTKAKSIEGLLAEQRAIIGGAAVRFGNPSVINALQNEYQSSHNPDVQQAIVAALCSSKDKKVIKQIIDWGMNDDSIIRPQDIDAWFAYLMRNPYGRDQVWQWLQKRWPHLMELFGHGKKMEYFIWYASKPITSPPWQKHYKEFFEPQLDNVSLKRNILISFSEIDSRVKWRQRDEAKITFWLKNNVK